MESVFEMITKLMAQFPANNLDEALIDEDVEAIRIKMEHVLKGVNFRNGYTVSITKAESLSFETWMNEINAVVPQMDFVMERMITKEITNQINLTYG